MRHFCVFILLVDISVLIHSLLKMCLSSRYWACPVASWAPSPAAEPSSARRSPCASGTGWRSSLVLSAGPEWSGRRGCSAATGSCRSAVEGNLSLEGSCAFGGCGCCWCGGCDGGCGPSSGGLWAGRFLSLGCPSSPCSDGKTKEQRLLRWRTVHRKSALKYKKLMLHEYFIVWYLKCI